MFESNKTILRVHKNLSLVNKNIPEEHIVNEFKFHNLKKFIYDYRYVISNMIVLIIICIVLYVTFKFQIMEYQKIIEVDNREQEYPIKPYNFFTR